METLNVARECLENKHFKDSINRAYYASFYAARAVLALERVDFKRHKDVIAYFNKNYVATGIFDREIGRNLARLSKKESKVITMIFLFHRKKKLKNNLIMFKFF